MAIEGALQDVSLADICQLLGMGGKTGCLSITDRSNFGYIYFEKGRVIYASVLNRKDRLGELLVRNHAITRKDLSTAVERQSETKGKKLGELLVEIDALSEEVLQRYIQVQIEEAVYHLFAWNQGSFHFDTGQMPDEDGIYLVSIPPEALLMEGARRVDEWSQVEKKIPSFDIVFQLDKHPDESDDDVDLTKAQNKVLPFIDGVRTVHEIMDEAGLVEFETGKALYGLIQAGYVSRSGERSTTEETGGDEALQQHLNVGIAFYRSGMLEDAAREFEQALALEPEQARANFMMGLIAVRRGQLEDALGHFGSMPPGASNAYSVHRNTALTLELLGRYDDALAALDEALVTKPTDAAVHLSRAIIHIKRGDIPLALDALRLYRTSPSVKKPSPQYYAYTVLAAGVSSDLDYAVAVGREGLGHYPDSGPILVNTGQVLERRGEVEAAAALYKRATQANPPLPQAHKNLGDHAYAHGDQEGARAQYEKAVKLAPRLGDDVYLRLGTLAYQGNDRDVAVLLWRRALDLNPNNQAVQANLEMLQGE
ncbi:MAG: tetratricopeptide repeat protein [Gemmatimonadetes bacterium]|nr:tetratricopeptide repeat protein [Gemmatimonadota bacterium]NNL30930.1 tetratricopeptide repeat protein [Gemmatimonadota bacterium]